MLTNIWLVGVLILAVSAVDQQCSSEDEMCKPLKENKYSKAASDPKYEPYLLEIEKAIDEYKPCDPTQCNCYMETIEADLSYFKPGIGYHQIENVRERGVTYQIIDHKLYRQSECLFPSRCSGIEHFLLKLLRKIPDVEIVVNTRDWPQMLRFVQKKQGPVFSFSKTDDYYDIMYPAWAFWEGGPALGIYPVGIGRWDKLRDLLMQAAEKHPWELKIGKAFFRGSRTSAERDPLIMLSRKHPDLVDAQYTKNQAWKSAADTLNAEPAKEILLEDHCKYRYLFNFRGVSASFRFKHLFLCKSLVFHVGDEWQEFFYPALKPWIHYIPVKKNATQKELKALIEFAVNNDEVAQQIAERGYDFVSTSLKLNHVACYWTELLKRYAQLQQFDIERNSSYHEIEKYKKDRHGYIIGSS